MTSDLDSRPLPTADLFAYNRKAVLRRLQQSGAAGSVLMFGFREPGRILTDYDPLFRQESYFWYMTGVNVPDCAAYIEIATGRATLFYPDIPADMAIWVGPQPPLEEIRQKYGFDEICLFDTLRSYIDARSPPALYSLTKELIVGDFSTDCELLVEAIGEQRQIKSEGELRLMRYSAEINNRAYRRVLRTLKPGLYEYQVEAELFGTTNTGIINAFFGTTNTGRTRNQTWVHEVQMPIALADLAIIHAVGAGNDVERHAGIEGTTFSSHLTNPKRPVYFDLQLGTDPTDHKTL